VVTARYGVRSMPTLIVFRNGAPAAMQVGAAPKGRLADWIKRAV
jgi:thioredoxin 1